MDANVTVKRILPDERKLSNLNPTWRLVSFRLCRDHIIRPTSDVMNTPWSQYFLYKGYTNHVYPKIKNSPAETSRIALFLGDIEKRGFTMFFSTRYRLLFRFCFVLYS